MNALTIIGLACVYVLYLLDHLSREVRELRDDMERLRVQGREIQVLIAPMLSYIEATSLEERVTSGEEGYQRYLARKGIDHDEWLGHTRRMIDRVKTRHLHE